jgi:hypothetical protein
MRILLRIFGILFLFCFLTVLTQIGGIVYLLTLVIAAIIKTSFKTSVSKFATLVIFVALYSAATFLIVPVIAKQFGRVPLPLLRTEYVQPLTIWTYLLNRHYVRPPLKELTLRVASTLQTKYPGTVINYLDAGFPFIDECPLPPHLSHNDGKKLDIAFLYRDGEGKLVTQCPSPIGYGIVEGPLPGETNRPLDCTQKGYWQYSALSRIIPQNTSLVFDATRTKAMTLLFARESSIGKIFIEPHLKERLGLFHEKIRLHGCKAVRHDDHIHVQLQ